MAALSARLEAGLTRHGLDAAGRAEVLAMIQAFARYGFVRGHAAAFAYLAYVSAWLKVYHPAIFCTALLNAQPMGFYPAETILQDAMRHGVRVLPIDVRASRATCTIEAGAVRLGLRLIQGLGAETCARLQDAVASLPDAHTLEALCLRARLTEDEATALARASALRGYIPDRRQALWRAPLIARAARARWLPGTAAALDQPAPLPLATPAEEMALDRAALGLSIRGHLLAPLRAELRRRSFRRIADLAAAPASLVVEVAGQIVSRQRPGTARGMVFLGLSDETGVLNVVVTPHVYQRDRAAMGNDALVWVTGVLERRQGVVSLRAKRIQPLTALPATQT